MGIVLLAVIAIAGIVGLASALQVVINIIRFKILSALGFFLLMWVCWVIISMIISPSAKLLS